jgi:hypothetical protein
MDSTHLPSFQGSEEDVDRRVEQCFDRLRTSLLCWSDTAPVLLEHTEDIMHESVIKYDFETKHICRDFEAIRGWTLENGVKGVTMGNAWWSGSS